MSILFSTGASGEPLIAPNDLVFDSGGGLWFTDHGRPWGPDPRPGSLYYGGIDGEPPRCVRGGLRSPNGIGLSPGGRTLFWADTLEGSLWSAQIDEPGRLAGAVTRLGSVPEGQMLDSLAVQEDGRVCVGTIGDGGISRFGGPPGLEHFLLPDRMITNICFGGVDRRDAFVTTAATGKVLRLRWPDPGLALAF